MKFRDQNTAYRKESIYITLPSLFLLILSFEVSFQQSEHTKQRNSKRLPQQYLLPECLI